VILLDIQMPIMDGVTALPEIKKVCPQTKIIMLTMMDDHSMITKLMELGANSYLSKTSDSEIIYEAIKTCFEQEYYFNSLTNNALLTNLKQRKCSTSTATAGARKCTSTIRKPPSSASCAKKKALRKLRIW
jgi:DNA-binding NarL/FixJ family response regulator